MRTSALFLVLLALFAAPCSPASGERVRFVSKDAERSYELHVPSSAAPQAPLLVLLHGSGGVARDMVNLWRDVADREGIVLAAPTAHDSRYWQLREDGPQMFRDLVDDIAARTSIDARRVYLFGHSGGAVYALTLAMLESEYFAAAAVHAGGWRTNPEFAVLAHARRKIPIALFVGDRDPFFPVYSVRQTEEMLRKQGHPTQLRIIPRHRHTYARVARTVNEEAWQFLRATVLNAEPRFQSYESSQPVAE